MIHFDFILREKSDALQEISKLCKELKSLKNMPIVSVRIDYGEEFMLICFHSFRVRYDISHNFSSFKTPQHKGVVELNDHTLEDMYKTMLLVNGLSKTFWVEAINTSTSF